MPPRKQYTYSDLTGRYRSAATGHFVRRDEIRRGVERLAKVSSDRIADISEQFRSRAITLSEWESRMRAEISAAHVAAALVAKGGREHMSQADWGRVGREVRDELTFLRAFADEVRNGAQPIDGRFTARAKMYGAAVWGTNVETMRREMERLGFDLEENVLTPGESCDGCIAETAKGRVPIGTLKKIGARTCRAHDRCHFLFTNSLTGEVAA